MSVLFDRLDIPDLLTACALLCGAVVSAVFVAWPAFVLGLSVLAACGVAGCAGCVVLAALFVWCAI